MRTRAQGLLLGATPVLIAALLAGCGGGDDEAGNSKHVKRDGEVYLASIGLSMVPPDGWEEEVSDESIELRSDDGTITMSLSSPLAGREPARVKKALIAKLRSELSPARVTNEGPGRLGERKVTSFQMAGLSRGRAVAVVGLVEDTPFRTYAVTLLTGKPSRKALLGSRDILRSVVLDEPVESDEDQ